MVQLWSSVATGRGPNSVDTSRSRRGTRKPIAPTSLAALNALKTLRAAASCLSGRIVS